MGAHLTHRIDEYGIEAGDHIYTWRTLYIYAHHGIYVGENKVIHFTPAGSGLSSGSASYRSCSLSYCGYKKAGSGVVMSCLKCFLESGKLYVYRYGLKMWEHLLEVRDGTSTTAQSDPPQEVIHRATYLLNNNVYGEYNLVLKNCEDFALYCKTGLMTLTGSSNQLNLVGTLRDLGVRPDVVKVKVEHLPIPGL